MSLFWTTVAGKSNQIGKNLVSSALAAGTDMLRSKLASGFKDAPVKFYYDDGAGGSIYRVVARKIAGEALAVAKEETDKLIRNTVHKLIGGNKLSQSGSTATWVNDQKQLAEEEAKNYGRLHDVFAIDDFGNVCRDAVMLAIPVNPPVDHKVTTYSGKIVSSQGPNSFATATKEANNWLVWYDVTGLVSVSSDKNLVLTQVAGRDYSRKELVSNGDVRFSITGHITSQIPDIYPSLEVQKFRQIMRYRGIVDVNNEVLNQWGVTKIVIQSFSMPPTEGSKSVQDYSFECVGIQPDTEADVKSDTIKVYDNAVVSETNSSGSLTWKDIIKNSAQNGEDVATEGTALATGLLDGML